MAVKKSTVEGRKVADQKPTSGPAAVLSRDQQGKLVRTPGALTTQQGQVVSFVIAQGMALEDACERANFADPRAAAAQLAKNPAFQAACERRQKRELTSIYASGMRQLGDTVRSGTMESDELIKVMRLIQDKVLPDAKAPEGDAAHGLEGLTIDKLDAAMAALKQANGDAAITIEGVSDAIDDAPTLEDEE